MGAAMAKGGATAKAAGAAGVLGAVATPILVVAGNYASYRMSLDEAQSDLERWHIKRLFRNSFILTLAICAIGAVPLFYECQKHNDLPLFWSTLVTSLITVYFLALGSLAFYTMSGRRRYLKQLLKERFNGQYPPAAYEYRSPATLFGVPLLHVRLGDRFDVIRPPLVAWIAIGSSYSVGLIFASGGLAIAPISFGGIAIGLLPFGAISMGALAIGAAALGIWVTGGIAVGWQVYGGLAAAWNIATGGVVFAHDYALGGIAHAVQANTDGARQFAQSNWFMRFAQMASGHPILTMLIWIIPLAIQRRAIVKARQRGQAGGAPAQS
jgi:hypothetical protein